MQNIVISISTTDALHIIYAIFAALIIGSGVLIRIAWTLSDRLGRLEATVKSIDDRVRILEQERKARLHLS
jgi:hypothetical protein